ncbi:MAG: hypothetical protein ACRDI0_11045 [Actinomycetota bacterium]
MRRARFVVAAILALSMMAAPAGPTIFGPMRAVAAEGVSAFVPQRWGFRPIPSSSETFRGIQASRNLDRWDGVRRPRAALEAYWIDATTVQVPSDYYYLAARGPAMDALPAEDRCTTEQHVWAGRGHRFEPPPKWPAEFVATATGSCGPRRWAAFVAAPGFGQTRAIGIRESGMYFVFVSVHDSPDADRRVTRLLSGVSFGGTSVGEFLDAVGASGQLE